MQRYRAASGALGVEIRGDSATPATSAIDGPVALVRDGPSAELAKVRRRPVSKRRRKARSLFRRWRSLSVRHTWITPLVGILLVLALYSYNPTPSSFVYPAIFLSYPLDHNPFATGQYGKGPLDLAFVGFYVLALSFAREFLMQVVLRPLAVRAGITGKSKQARFLEQSYTAVYFAVFGPLGLYIMSRTPIWYFRTGAFFEGFPHRTLDGPFKAYYLLQAAYWAQQAIVLVLQLEKPRKDFKELVGHHIITLTLIGLSYRFHFTSMGLAVYVTHDVSDFFLAMSKSLNYVDSPIVTPWFSVFICVWIYMRHYLNLHILWATLTEFRTIGPYELNWETQQYKCLLSQLIAFSLLASLQAVNLFWLFLIVRVAKRIVFNNIVADERSEVEDNDEDDPADDDTAAAAAAAAAAPALQQLPAPLTSDREVTSGLADIKHGSNDPTPPAPAQADSASVESGMSTTTATATGSSTPTMSSSATTTADQGSSTAGQEISPPDQQQLQPVLRPRPARVPAAAASSSSPSSSTDRHAAAR